MRVVLDTNVIVSGLLSQAGPPGRIVALVPKKLFKPCFDARILTEYREVLLRPRLAIAPRAVEELLADLEKGYDVAYGAPHRNPGLAGAQGRSLESGACGF